MTHWEIFTPYERFISLLGHLTLIVIIIIIVGLVLVCLMEVFDRKDAKASKPVDHIDFTNYDSSANVKKVGHELREITRKGRRI